MMSSTLFASVLSCLLVFAHAGSEECPQFDCREPKCWDSSTAYSTYVYLEDGTKCPGCKKCIWDDAPGLGGGCPPMACPVWNLPATCKPRFFSLNFKYHDRECGACDTYVCTGN